MIDRAAGNRSLPETVRQDIIERTDGVPLFVEEMIKAVLEAEGEEQAQQPAAANPSSAVAVPVTLHALLMARLDRLGSAKEVAQIGAAIGREFPHVLLAAATRKPETEVRLALDRLIAAGLLFRQGTAPHATYLFKHALVQDAAYSTLLRGRRRALHAQIAETLESQLDVAGTHPELLARHFSEAGLIQKAVHWWAKAGRRSLERSALVEAVEQLNRANSLVETLSPTAELRREQFKLQVALISPLGHLKGFASPEARAAVGKARALVEQAEKLDETAPRLSSVLFGLWVASYNAFDGDGVRGLANEYLAIAEQDAALIPLMIGHRIVGISLLCTGDFVSARAHFDQALAFYNPREHRPLAGRLGLDAGVSVLSQRSFGLWLLGHPMAALADANDAVEQAHYIAHAPTLMDALTFATFTLIECGSFTQAGAQVEELLRLANEKGALLWKAVATILQGRILASRGKVAEAVQIITAGIDAFGSTGATLNVPTALSELGLAHAALGQYANSRRCMYEALKTAQTTKEKWYEAEIERRAGEIAVIAEHRAMNVDAEAHFMRALAVAREQQAKSWEFRAAMSLARRWRDQGKMQQARELLAPVYGWFTEGFDTRDLKEAKALLDELT
jgi:predicted ATPase